MRKFTLLFAIMGLAAIASAQTMFVTGTLTVDEDADLPTTWGLALDGGTLEVTDDATFYATRVEPANPNTPVAGTNLFFTTPNGGTIDIATGKTLLVDGTFSTGIVSSTIDFSAGNFWFYNDAGGSYVTTRHGATLDIMGGGTLEIGGDVKISSGTAAPAEINITDNSTLKFVYKTGRYRVDDLVKIRDTGTLELVGTGQDDSGNTIGHLYGGGRVFVSSGRADCWAVDKNSLYLKESSATKQAIVEVADGAWLGLGSNQTQSTTRTNAILVDDPAGTVGEAKEYNNIYSVEYVKKTGSGTMALTRDVSGTVLEHQSLKVVWDVQDGILSSSQGLGSGTSLGYTASKRNQVDSYGGYDYHTFHKNALEGLYVHSGAKLEWEGTQGYIAENWSSTFTGSAGDGFNDGEFIVQTGSTLAGGAPTDSRNTSTGSYGGTLNLGFEDATDGTFLCAPRIAQTFTGVDGAVYSDASNDLALEGGINFRSGLNVDAGVGLLDITVNNHNTARLRTYENPDDYDNGISEIWVNPQFATNGRVIKFTGNLTGADAVDVFQTLDIQTGGVEISQDHLNVTSTTVAAAGADVEYGYDKYGNVESIQQDAAVLRFNGATALTYAGSITSAGIVETATGTTTLTGTLASTGETNIAAGATLQLASGDRTSSIDTAGLTLDGTLGLNGATGVTLLGTDTTAVKALITSGNLAAEAGYAVGYKTNGSDIDLLGALAGDANLDQLIDNVDIGAVFGNYGVGTTWEQGDFNNDSLVDNVDIGSVFGNYGTSYEADPGKADLVYDPATGNVTLDGAEAAGGVIANFVITDDEGGLVGAPAQTNPFLGAFFTNTEFQLSGSDPLTTGLATIEFAGLLPAGLTLAEVQDMLDSATYVGSLGSGVQDFDIVPEPATMSLLGFGALALIRRKK